MRRLANLKMLIVILAALAGINGVLCANEIYSARQAVVAERRSRSRSVETTKSIARNAPH